MRKISTFIVDILHFGKFNGYVLLNNPLIPNFVFFFVDGTALSLYSSVDSSHNRFLIHFKFPDET